MKKYSNRLVVVHWMTLLLFMAALYLGYSVSQARQAGNATLAAYQAHLLLGDVVLVLTLLRIFFKRKDGAPATTGNTWLDKFAKAVHHALYAILVLLPVSGMATVATSAIAKALSAGDAKLLPSDFASVPMHDVHMGLMLALVALVAVHVLGAIKHQIIDKDDLMDRMSFRRK